MNPAGPALLEWRAAVAGDAPALRDLERAANLVGLAHVFDPVAHPYPDRAVLEHWQRTLAEPGVTVSVVEGGSGEGLVAFVAHDARRLRHLAVHPRAWGRGLGAEGVARAVAAIAPRRAVLWVLVDNVRARALYERLGWRPTGPRQPCPWEPHPVEMEYEAGDGPAPDGVAT